MMCASLQYDYKYMHIISGEDYPIKTMEEFDKFFLNTNNIFADFKLVKKNHPAYKRYHYYWPYVMFSMDYKKTWVRYFNLLTVGVQMFFPFFF